MKQKRFTLQEFYFRYYYRDFTFEYALIHKMNRPQPLKTISSVSFKLKDTACEMCSLIRFFPVIIGDRVEENNQTREFYIKFVILVERLASTYFSNPGLTILGLLIDQFFVASLKFFQMQILNLKHNF